MPSEQQLAHRVVRDTNVPYISNQSPIVTEPCFVPGAQDLMTSVNGYSERRPGFALNVEPTPTTFFGGLGRLFTWEDFNGNFFVMCSNLTAGSEVYKMQVGTDASFILLYTDPNPILFDFVASNGTVYFGNGLTMKKWNATIGLENWGIAVGSVNSATGPNTAGTGANDSGFGTAWTNPTNVTSAVSFATVGLVTGSGGGTSSQSQGLNATNYGFAISATSTIQGIAISFQIKSSAFYQLNHVIVQLLKNGNPIGTFKSTMMVTASLTTITLGGTSDLWGASWTANDINQSAFGFKVIVAQDGPVHTTTYSVNDAQVTIYSLGGPGVSPTGSGSMAATIGYEYVFCYGNSMTGHISSPTPVSNSTGPFGGAISTATVGAAGTGYVVNDTGLISAGNGAAAYKVLTVDANGAVLTFSITAAGATYLVQNLTPTTTAGAQPGKGTGFAITITAVTGIDHVAVTLTASTDSQVNQIHVFRTTDSAAPGTQGGTFFEIPTSPYPNTSTTISDNAPDSQLNLFSVAPIPTFNDPPPPSQGMVYYSGRIWMFTGNKVWFTGLEEIVNGVPEESVPSGVAGNFWTFDQNVEALAVAGSGNNQTLAILCGGRLYGIQGNSLDTFRRFKISDRRGSRNRTTVSMLGGMAGWFDTANQIWSTDGSSLQELSIPIRPDLVNLNQQNCSMTFHVQGRLHWLVFSTGTKLFVYDMDTEQWMPPWSFACQYIYSGETSPGNYQLMASIGTRAVALNPNAFNDVGVTYSPIIRTNLFGIVPDFGRRFSYVAAGMYDEPSRTGQVWYVQVDTNGIDLADMLYIIDDDPTQGAYTSIKKDETTVERAFNRFNHAFVKQHVFAAVKPTGRWYGLQINLANADQQDKIFGWFIAYKALR